MDTATIGLLEASAVMAACTRTVAIMAIVIPITTRMAAITDTRLARLAKSITASRVTIKPGGPLDALASEC
jgi:hypothetical protein